MDASFELAQKRYAALNVDADAAMERLKSIPVSMHCWQGDDVIGFDHGGALDGGIQVTGNYPGRARDFKELTADIKEACALIPGKKRLNLHASYALPAPGETVDRDALLPRHFAPWVQFAKENGMGLDFNPTFFSHPKAAGLTLSNPDDELRAFWVRHGVCCRRIAQYFADELHTPCLCNVWAPDGLKDAPADRLSPRQLFTDSLNKIFAEPLPDVIDSVESKLFGIGLEAYTVGSSEVCLTYAATHKNVYPLLDSGHFHPTEVISDKLSALLCAFQTVPLHVSRPMRWDSDHVVTLSDELREIALEIVRCDAIERVMIGLDFFDASINRIAAWVIGMRDMQKALLYALLSPNARMKTLQREKRFTELLMLQEEVKTLPFGAVWEEYCRREGVPVGEQWFERVMQYEESTLKGRV